MNNSTTTSPSNDGNTGLRVVESLKVVIGLFGFCGNFLSFIILKKRTAKNHTNFLILNQSLVDLTTSIFLIARTLSSLLEVKAPSAPILGYAFCLLWDSSVFLWSFFAISSFNLTVISMERYIAVLHPVWYRGFFNRSITLLLASMCWLFGPVFNVAYNILTNAYGDGVCRRTPPTVPINVLSVFLFFWEYFFPVGIMTFSFVSIVRKFLQMNRVVAERNPNSTSGGEVTSQAPQANQPSAFDQSGIADQGNSSHDPNGDDNVGSIQISGVSREVRFMRERNRGESSEPVGLKQRDGAVIRRQNTTKVLLVVYLAYIICWTPNQWYFVQYNLGGTIDFQGVFYYITIIMATCNSCVNPIIYVITMKSFKKDLKGMFKFCLKD